MGGTGRWEVVGDCSLAPLPSPGGCISPGPTWALSRTYFRLVPGALAPASGWCRSGEFPGTPFLSPEPGREGRGGALSSNPNPAASPRELPSLFTQGLSNLGPGRQAPLPAAGQWYGPVQPGLLAPSHPRPGSHHRPLLGAACWLGWARGSSSPAPTPPEKVKRLDTQENPRR